MKRLFNITIVITLLACTTCTFPLTRSLTTTSPAQIQLFPGTSTAVPLSTHLPGPSINFNYSSIGDPYAPELGNKGYDVSHYTLRLTIDPLHRFILATALLQFICTQDDLDQIWIDFVGYTINDILLDGNSIRYSRNNSKLILIPSTPLQEGQTHNLEVSYQGAPPEQQSEFVPFVPYLGLYYSDQQSVFALGEPDGGREWFPCNDHPRDKATFRFELTVPAGLTGIANGHLMAIDKGIHANFTNSRLGDRYIWDHPYPLAPALATVIVGRYQVKEDQSPNGIKLRSYISSDQVDGFTKQAAKIGPMLDWMAQRFSSYPFGEFGYVTVPGAGTSLEAQSMVILGNTDITETVMAHEMAHMWFGDWVSLDSWGEMWRNEGLATYVAQMWLHRNDPKGLDAEIDQYREMIRSQPSGYPLNNPPRAQLFGRDSYIKGAVFAHELRKAMGDKAFFGGLRSYFRLYGGKTACDSDFQVLMEKAAGKSLEKLFHQWLVE